MTDAPDLARPRAAGPLYGVASLAANLLSYALLVVFSRGLDPARYGALGSILGVAIVASVLSIALQLVVAREVATVRSGGSGRVLTRRFAVLMAAAVSLTVLALSPAIAHYLRLGSVWPVVWLALLLLPGTAIGGLLGELLGLERFGRLSVAVVLVSGMRLLSGVVASLAGWGVTGSVAALAGGTWLAWLVVLQVSPGVSALHPSPGGRRHELVETLRAAERVGAFLLLSNLDVLLARHFLSARDSGIYVLASLFAKAGLWGPQFVAVLAYPRLAAGRERARTLVRAAVWIAALGGGIALASVVVADPLVRGMSGEAYAPAARLAPWFALLGTGLALVHLCMIATVAVGERTFGIVIWAAAAVEAVAVSVGPHERPAQVLGICLVVTAAVVGAGVLSLLRHRRAQLRPDPLGLAPLP